MRGRRRPSAQSFSLLVVVAALFSRNNGTNSRNSYRIPVICHSPTPENTMKISSLALVTVFATAASAFGLNGGAVSAVQKKVGFAKSPLVQPVDIHGNNLDSSVSSDPHCVPIDAWVSRSSVSPLSHMLSLSRYPLEKARWTKSGLNWCQQAWIPSVTCSFTDFLRGIFSHGNLSWRDFARNDPRIF